MTFLEALATKRPMRRVAWFKRLGPIQPKAEDAVLLMIENTWVWPRLSVEKKGESCWLNINTGEAMSLMRPDYEADDWECLP